MIRIAALAVAFLVALAADSDVARADCSLAGGGSRPNGAIIKNTDHNVLQYCDNTTWRLLSLGGGSCFETWTARDSDRDWADVAMSSDGTKLVATVVGGQIYTSTDSGATWTARDSNRNWGGVASSADGTKLVAVANGGQIYTSTNSGVSWTPRNSNRNWVKVASSADGVKLVATVWGGQIYTSTDSGVNWTARASAQDWYAVASSADGVNLAAGAYFDQIYTSSNSGVNWTAREDFLAWNAMAASSDGTKFAAAEANGEIYTSSDSGVNWTAQPGAGISPWGEMSMSDDGSRLIVTSGDSDVPLHGPLVVSLDGGVTWAAKGQIRLWNGAAISGDGTRAAAVVLGGKIYTSECTGGIVGGGGCIAPSLCPNVGDVCDDGNAGNNPDPKFAGWLIYANSGQCERVFVAQSDQSTNTQWKTSTGADDITTDSVEDGQINDSQVADSATFPAFKLCKDLTDGGYTDWYLPARAEAEFLWRNKALIGGFVDTDYWSSTEGSTTTSWFLYFGDADGYWRSKTSTERVRCIRRD